MRVDPDERFHDQMHRLYRAVRGRVALRVSPLSPAFAATVRDEFRVQCGVVGLTKGGK